ncbi:hypothetical protein Psuf_043690 [Phytohabitans suffuscus]|uniref:Uncharacterized protein n=1 Tax=Phytohabitans suffuscus TaxID=624315 RepID=A0A6F8YLY1_9ACTN|nr:hypothetical protein Psuf_043690 [Phytohabitans suffuscus]
MVERRRAHRLDHHVDPLGQAGAGLQRGGAQLGDALALGGVTARGVHPLAERGRQHHRRGRHAAPAPWTRTDWASSIRPRLVSMRYAVSHAVGRHAASAKDTPAGLGTTLARGTATRSAIVPG